MIYSKLSILASVVGLIAASSGCQQPSLYEWGRYEASVLRMYSPDKSYEVHKEIDYLIQEIEKTERQEKQVPPGKRLHLGYLFYMSGDKDSTRHWFEAEKRAFPESEVFVDGLLGRMK